jgi:hypothetical protein
LAAAFFFFNGCFGFLSDILYASFLHIIFHPFTLFPCFGYVIAL